MNNKFSIKKLKILVLNVCKILDEQVYILIKKKIERIRS